MNKTCRCCCRSASGSAPNTTFYTLIAAANRVNASGTRCEWVLTHSARLLRLLSIPALVGIFDPFESESVRGGDDDAFAPTALREALLRPHGIATSPPNLNERADDRPHHRMAEGVGLKVEDKQSRIRPAPRAVDVETAQGADGRRALSRLAE